LDIVVTTQLEDRELQELKTRVLGVVNLLDEKAFVYHPYPGRTFVLSLKWDGRL
jgi:hypothetical protein